MKRLLSQMQNVQTDWPCGVVFRCQKNVPIPAQQELAPIIVGVPTPYVERSNLFLYVALCSPGFVLALSLIRRSLQVGGQLAYVLEAAFVEVDNLVPDAQVL